MFGILAVRLKKNVCGSIETDIFSQMGEWISKWISNWTFFNVVILEWRVYSQLAQFGKKKLDYESRKKGFTIRTYSDACYVHLFFFFVFFSLTFAKLLVLFISYFVLPFFFSFSFYSHFRYHSCLFVFDLRLRTLSDGLFRVPHIQCYS